MGADDHHLPHHTAQEPRVPCVDGTALSHNPVRRPPHGPVAQQVTESTSYAIAGKVLLAAAGALAGVLLALLALYLYNSSRRRRLSGGRRRLLRSLAIAGAGDDSRDGGGGAAASSPRGLDPAVLRALPVVAAGAGDGDCAVCLAGLEPGEKARALPRCGHRFHVECIDAWFQGNATCPLCRADVEAPDAAAADAAQREVRIDVAGDAVVAPAKVSIAPAMGRLPSGTNLDKTRRVLLRSDPFPSDRLASDRTWEGSSVFPTRI